MASIRVISNFFGEKSTIVIEAFLGDLDMEELVDAMNEAKLTGDDARIFVSTDSTSLSSAFSYYKKNNLDMSRPIFVVYENMPAIDAGGPRRQLFSDIIIDLRDKHALFEGPINSRYPVYSTGVVASGLLKVLGRVVVHSILHEGLGFPFLAPCIYNYICTSSVEDSSREIDIMDMSPPFRDMVNKVM